jgi:hypothetical protein
MGNVNRGKIGPMKGKHHSIKTKQKLSMLMLAFRKKQREEKLSLNNI